MNVSKYENISDDDITETSQPNATNQAQTNDKSYVSIGNFSSLTALQHRPPPRAPSTSSEDHQDEPMQTESPAFIKEEEVRTETPLSPTYSKEEEEEDMRTDTPQSPENNGGQQEDAFEDTPQSPIHEYTETPQSPEHLNQNNPVSALYASPSDDATDQSNEEEESSDNEYDEDDVEDESEDDDEQELEDVHEEEDNLEIEIFTAQNPKTYYVLRQDKDGDKVYHAKVLRARSSENTDKLDEFYVHYVGHDRRQDEWVPKKRIAAEPQHFGKHCSSDIISADGIGQIALTVDLGTLSLCDKKFSRNQRSLEGGHGIVAKYLNREAQTELEHENLTAVKYITTLQFSGYSIGTWYYSPFPNDYEKISNIYVCQYCMRYMKYFEDLCYHEPRCNEKEPPGRIVYKKDNLAIFEVLGKDNVIYCQCLCLMAKLFLDHKALFYDVAPFTFYILCQLDGDKAHMVGYFSKEADSADNNLACLLIMPPYQRRGYGKLLIGFSYELSRRDSTSGSPEKPLSDMGRLSYRSFWGYTILTLLSKTMETAKAKAPKTSVTQIVNQTGIAREDVIFTLNILGMIKYWADGHTICIHPDSIKKALEFRQYRKPTLMVDPNLVLYKPPQKSAQ